VADDEIEGSLSPQGLATRKPMEMTLCMKASSATSPRRLEMRMSMASCERARLDVLFDVPTRLAPQKTKGAAIGRAF
jgi:hypothetical protein